MTACSVIMTLKDEPGERVAAAVASLVRSLRPTTTVELVIAARSEEPCVGAAVGGWTGRSVVVANPSGERSSGLNLAARASSGSYLVRIDARTRVPRGYVERCLSELECRPQLGIVGGHQVPISSSEGFAARAVARALQNPLVLGAPAYRRRSAAGSVDTVYLGAFRREEFLAIGGYDERLRANEDFDLCLRYTQSGKLVWLIEALDVEYLARSDLRGIWAQYHAFGRSKVDFWMLRREPPNRRQMTALAAAVAMVGIAPLVVAKPSRLAAVFAVGGLGMLVIDWVGNRRAASILERGGAAAVSGVITAAWLSGVAAEVLSRARRARRSRASSSGRPSPTQPCPDRR